MFTLLDQTTVREVVASTSEGILLCFKKLCPHCKNMEKVLEKFSISHPSVALFCLDSEESPEGMAALEAERVPTLVVIRNGRVVARKAGLMNPKELAAWYGKIGS